MAEIVIAIVAKVAEILVEPAIRQGQYLFCVNKFIRNLDDEKKKLISKRDSILTCVQQAKERTEEIEDAVRNWLDDVKNQLDEVEQLERDVKESHCFQGWCPTRRTYRLCKKISKRPKKISDLIATSNFEPFSHPAPLPGTEYGTSQNFTCFESTKVAYNQLLEALEDDNTYMIGLYGMGGSGKTTLATEVGKKAKSELKLFDQVITITMSQTPNIERIQEKMEDMLGFKMDEKSQEGRAQRLWLRLKIGKPVLIIVDDVWAELDLKEIGIRLEDNKKPNFKVLLTTRLRRVCDLMNCQRKIFLHLLSDSDGWMLFQKHAGIGEGSSSNLLKVAREVSDECKGLPIAIKAVGSSLKGTGDDEWKVALEKLRNPEKFDDNGEEGFTKTFTCLKLSYDYLRNKEAEMLFLMCSMFPEDHEISIEDLVRYGVGLGICGNFNSFDLARSSIKVGINKLVNSCLLFRYENIESHVKMHDVVRDVALCIASRVEVRKILVKLASNLNALAENEALKDYFAISSWYAKTDLISYQLDAPRLEILLLQTRNENSLDFSFASSDGVKELKVMSILNSYYPQPLLLLQSTQWLTNLRTLRLSGWNLGDLSFVISLTRLEALDLRNCNFTELPKGMEKLDRLKLLDLSDCKLPKNFNYEALGRFSQLEELYADGLIFPSEVMKNIVTLPNLQRFRISRHICSIDDKERTRVLSLHNFNIYDLGASKQNLLQRAEHVFLEFLHGGCKNVTPDMVRVVGGMNELTNLCFKSCSEIECLIDTTYGSFQVDTLLPKLVKLRLSEMDNLKAVVSLLSVSVAQSLQQLEELSIEGCEELEHIITSEGEGGTNTGDNSHLRFPNLKKLSVSSCPKLEFIFPISFALQGLLQLQEIRISEAAQLEVIFRHSSEYNIDNTDQIMFPSLEKLQLEKLPSFVNVFQGFNFQAPKLQEISTHECPKCAPILRGTQGISLPHTEVEQLEQDVKANQCFQESCPTCGKSGIECSTSQNFMYFESTKAAYDELLEALKDDSAHMIGLYGRGGSGKTTLATEVGEKAKSEMNLFDQVILVTVSQTPNIRSIQGRMADLLNLKLEEESEEGRARRLCLRLREVKSVLIIVDDVWKMFNLKEIGIRLDDNDKPNFKILLTTRQRQVCELMDCQTQIFLKHLSDGDAWSLFHKHANIGSGSSSNLLEVAREVSDKCKGLPIAIKAVGSSLKEKGDHEWKVALERLRNPEQFDDNGEEGFADAFTCLKLSYDYLRNKEAEVLFLICSMFPEDHEISIEDLIRYGVGLGLSGDFISFDLARSCIKAGINRLVHSCLLFYNEKEDHVKMHDVARDVALCIASRVEDRKILVNLANDLNAFAISSWNDKNNLISYQLDAPRLEILLLQTRNKNSQDFSFASSDGVKELKVMSILNSYYPQSLLLQSTQWLTNLRTLRLSGWNLGDMSFLVNLTTLEALDLRRCHFTELPKGMGKLNKLKLLDLSKCEISKNFNYEAIGSCLQLEELYAFGYNQKCPSQRMEDIVALPNLRRFVIQLGWFRTIYYEECIRVLHLLEFNISNLGESKQNLLQRAEDVCLDRLHGGRKNIIPDMVRLVGDMKELTNLGFRSCSEIECLIDTNHHHAEPFQVDTSLPRLVKLELFAMDNLKEVCRGPPSLVLGFFKKLEQLFIKHCRQLHNIFPEACNLCNLKILKIGNYGNIRCNWNLCNCTAVVSLFSVSVAQSLQQLEELSIEGCKNLKHIITSEGEGGTNTEDNSQLRFPNLKKLLVSFCPELEFIFPISFDPQGLLQLQELQISHSSGLKYVFGQYEHEPHSSHGQIMLPSLNVFQLYDLENLLGVCPENYYLSYSSSVKLRCSDCPKLTKSCINVTVSSK